jgi:hypothetical protein
MIAKTGDVKVWHWAHATEQPGCPSEGESEWHLAWKAAGLPGTQEKTVGNRRADVLAPSGYAIEFQKSAMSGAGVLAREKDWKRKLIWVFDVSEAREAGRLELRINPSKPEGDGYRHIEWSHALERVRAATCQVILDLDGENMLYLGKWYESSPLMGYGWLVTREWVEASIVRGDKIVRPPGWVEPSEHDRRRPRSTATRHLRVVPSYPEPGDHGCPLCRDDHARCVFAAGSLYCVTAECANPHHRVADAFVPYLAPTGTG